MLGRVLCCLQDFPKDKVTYVESSHLHLLVEIFGHCSPVLFHLLRSFVFHLDNQIQIIVEFLVVPLLFVRFDPDVRQSYFH